MIIKQIIAGFVLIFLISCTSNPDDTRHKSDNQSIFFEELKLVPPGEKLIISARFEECGEWGGHIENMIIQGKDNEELYLDYQKFKINCDSINSNNGTPIQVLEIEKTLKLNQNNNRSILDYMQRMIKSKAEERFPGHSGNSFTVLKSDSSLLIKVYDSKAFDESSYNKLLEDLKLN